MEKIYQSKWLQGAALLCIAFLILNLGVGVFRYGVKKVCVDKLKMGDNAIVREIVPQRQLPPPKPQGFKWEELYPFRDENPPIATAPAPKAAQKENGALARLKALDDRYSKKFAAVGGWLPDYIQPGKLYPDLKARYDRAIGFSLNIKSQNSIIYLPDGYLTGKAGKISDLDVKLAVDGMTRLRDFCAARGIPVLYMQVPMKISDRTDPEVSGKSNMSNQNADRVVAALREAGIDTFDLHDHMRDFSAAEWHGLFFRTDHHWRPEGALWGAGLLTQELEQRYGLAIDREKLAPENFRKVVFEKRWLGSRGQALGKGQVEPDDVSLFYPKYKTLLEFDLSDAKKHLAGPFSIIYNMEGLRTGALYHAYGYGDRAQLTLKNRLAANDTRLLVIRDSFGDTEVPFLSLTVSRIDALDVRHFGGSVETYIDEVKPSVVVVQYYAGELVTKINHSVTHHSHVFDCR